MRRIKHWWSGRPYHKVTLRSHETGRKIETLRFRDDEWALLLLAMGALGCRNPGEAVHHAMLLAADRAQGFLEEAHAPPAPPTTTQDIPTGMYL